MADAARRYTDEVPDDVEARVRELCLGLPDAYEERAWVGTRWMVRERTFAHVLGLEDPSTGPSVVLAFRSADEELEVLRHAGQARPNRPPVLGRDRGVARPVDAGGAAQVRRRRLQPDQSLRAVAKLAFGDDHPPRRAAEGGRPNTSRVMSTASLDLAHPGALVWSVDAETYVDAERSSAEDLSVPERRLCAWLERARRLDGRCRPLVRADQPLQSHHA